MDTELKRLTISISPCMELELDVAKREYYRGDTQNDMIKDLIVRGLSSLNAGKEQIRKVC